MTGFEPIVMGAATGVQTVVSGALNTFTPVRGETVVTSAVAIAEKPSDLQGEWMASSPPITGVTKLRFYKKRSALITPNVLKTVERGAERVKDKASVGISSLKEKFASKPSGKGFLNLDKSEKAKEKHEALKEKVQAKKYKTRCLIPIDVHYT